MKSGQSTKLITLSLFGIVINIGIGVNVEGLTRVIPSSFSNESGNTKNIFLMKVKPNYKLPSFRLGFMEVVTAVAHAAVASFLVSPIIKIKYQMNSLLKAVSDKVPSGWSHFTSTTSNTAFSQTRVTGRMVDEMAQVNQHPQFISYSSSIVSTTLCAAAL